MSKYLIIPNRLYEKKDPQIDFLFPLKGFCVGMIHEWTIEEIKEDSYIYVNRILDTQGIEDLGEILKSKKIKGIVFEDLGILEKIKEANLGIETILYATHALTGIDTINAYLKYCDTIIISPDITKEEIEEILKKANRKVCLYTYGPIPYMYSRRNLLTHYQKEFQLEMKSIENLEEEQVHKSFKAIENMFGTVLYDQKKYDGRVFLNHDKIKYYLINLDWEEEIELETWVKDFLSGKEIENTTSGFLNQKTIYRLPPKGKDV